MVDCTFEVSVGICTSFGTLGLSLTIAKLVIPLVVAAFLADTC
jgi:hypothetical protein